VAHLPAKAYRAYSSKYGIINRISASHFSAWRGYGIFINRGDSAHASCVAWPKSLPIISNASAGFGAARRISASQRAASGACSSAQNFLLRIGAATHCACWRGMA